MSWKFSGKFGTYGIREHKEEKTSFCRVVNLDFLNAGYKGNLRPRQLRLNRNVNLVDSSTTSATLLDFSGRTISGMRTGFTVEFAIQVVCGSGRWVWSIPW